MKFTLTMLATLLAFAMAAPSEADQAVEAACYNSGCKLLKSASILHDSNSAPQGPNLTGPGQMLVPPRGVTVARMIGTSMLEWYAAKTGEGVIGDRVCLG